MAYIIEFRMPPEPHLCYARWRDGRPDFTPTLALAERFNDPADAEALLYTGYEDGIARWGQVTRSPT